MSVLSIPNVFVAGTTINAAPFNTNFNAVATAVNNIDSTNIGAAGLFASNLIPTTTVNATFGGPVGYTFLAPTASTTPLTISGTAGQSANIFNVTLTSGGTNALTVTAAGVLQTALNGTSGQLNFGSAAGTLDYGETTSGRFTFSSTVDLPSANLLVTGTGFVLIGTTAIVPAGGGLSVSQGASAAQITFGGASFNSAIDVGITNASAFSFHGTGGYAPVFGGTYTPSSDASLKKNVQAISYGLAAVNALLPRSFDWIASDKHDVGFVAQEVVGVIPEVVSTDNNGICGVNYSGIVPVLAKAIQEQSAASNELLAAFNAYVAAHP